MAKGPDREDHNVGAATPGSQGQEPMIFFLPMTLHLISITLVVEDFFFSFNF